jgi:hypothetical protein
LLAVIAYENEPPTTAVAELELLIAGAESGTLIVSERVAEPVPEAFVALIVTFDTLDAVGVPLMTPEFVLMLNPAGKPVAL